MNHIRFRVFNSHTLTSRQLAGTILQFLTVVGSLKEPMSEYVTFSVLGRNLTLLSGLKSPPDGHDSFDAGIGHNRTALNSPQGEHNLFKRWSELSSHNAGFLCCQGRVVDPLPTRRGTDIHTYRSTAFGCRYPLSGKGPV